MSFRRRIWIDGRIQGILVGRIIIYWLATVAYFGIGIAVSQYCDQPHWTLAEHWQAWLAVAGPWIPSTCLLLPLVLYDIIRTSHAFTGPIVRVRNQLTKLCQNPNCTPIVLRQDDYWHDLIGPVNTVQHHVLSLHMAIQKQREFIEELRSDNKADSVDTGIEAPTDSSKLAAHRIAQVAEVIDIPQNSEQSIGAAS
jgi:hypothetical protein